MGQRAGGKLKRLVAITAAALALSIGFVLAACTPAAIAPTTTNPKTPRWEVTFHAVPTAVAGGPVTGRLILTYAPYLSAPPTNDVTFTAVCVRCTGPTPVTVKGRLVLTPEQCAGAPSLVQPPPDSKTCWSAPVTFDVPGTWHFTTPYDIDLVIP